MEAMLLIDSVQRIQTAAIFALTVWNLMVPPRFLPIPAVNWERRAVFDSKAVRARGSALAQASVSNH